MDALQRHPVACPITHVLTRVHFSGEGCEKVQPDSEVGQQAEAGVLKTVMKSVSDLSNSVSTMLLDSPRMRYNFECAPLDS